MKKLTFLITFSLLLSSCTDINNGINSQTIKSIFTPKDIHPSGIKEFQIDQLSETQFRKIASRRGYQIEECNDIHCLAEQKESRVIKLTQPDKGNAALAQFKYGPKVSTYILYNYKVGNKYNTPQITLFFYEDHLIMARLDHPNKRLVTDLKKEFPIFSKRGSTTIEPCSINGVEVILSAPRLETNWNESQIFMRHKKGPRIDFTTCQLVEDAENNIHMSTHRAYWILEEYSDENRF